MFCVLRGKNHRKSGKECYRYKLISETSVDDENIITEYGISAYVIDENGAEIEVESYRQLSCDRDAVVNLTKLCNSNGLDLIHFRDIAEDFVTEI